MLKHDNISQKREPFLEAHLFSAFLFYCFARSRPVRSLQRTCVHGNILVSSCTLACKNRHDVILVQGSLDEILLHFTFSAIWVYNRSRAVSGLLYFEHRQNLLLCFDRGQTCLWVHVHKTSFFFLSETWHCYYVSKRVKCGPSHVTNNAGVLAWNKERKPERFWREQWNKLSWILDRMHCLFDVALTVA